MARSTIDFGIDLGTTNSAIAVLRGATTEIIKNNRDTDITPSAVYIDKKGRRYVGQSAKDRSMAFPDDAYMEFKRLMGTGKDYLFAQSGIHMKPEDLSAEVLKSLREDVRQRMGEDIQAAVVTVPAAFDLGQCSATKTAAQLAGLVQCPLVQEPVAAALAYGFQADAEKAYWLVYDFGGGTFDAAIIKAEEGTVTVVNHGGNNHLGGSDIDWAIVDTIILPDVAREHGLRDFKRGNQRWESAIRKIKRAVELAKIQLSRNESTFLEDCRFEGERGDEIEVDIELSRSAVARVAEPIIMQSVKICHDTLREKNLAPSAIEKIILVGGPTLAPYFRDILAAQLPIAIDHSVDPLTVVSRGAAVFAGTQRVDATAQAAAPAGAYKLDLTYKPIGIDPDPTVRGKITAPNGGVDGFTIEIANAKTRWRSGKISLGGEGKFKLRVLAEKGEQNVFAVELHDARGARHQVSPDSFTYMVGTTISDQPVINSLGVALANNEYEVFIRKGDTLPAKVTRVLRTRQELRRGQSGDLLKVPIVEGENDRADCNRLVGYLEVRGNSVKRDMPAGTETEVQVSLDASRQLTVRAYIPMLDEEFETSIDLARTAPDVRELEEQLNLERKRLQEARSKAGAAADGQVMEKLASIDNELQEPQRLVGAARTDMDAAVKAERELLRLRAELDGLEGDLKWPALVAEARQVLAEVEQNLSGDPTKRDALARLRQDMERAIEEKRPQQLERRMDEARRMLAETLFSRPEFWVGAFEFCAAQQHMLRDPARGRQLINQGRQCLASGDLQGLEQVVRQLIPMLPQEAAAQLQRGYQSGVLR